QSPRLSCAAPAPSDLPPLPLHDALPICSPPRLHPGQEPLRPPVHVLRRARLGRLVAHPVRLRAQRGRLLLGVGPLAAAAPPRAEDRKSTRLNSSHVAISYAVFCLKKTSA